MLSIKDIKSDMDMINAIDWEMTPEEAVTLYLEWGNNWAHGRVIRSRDDVSHYFVINTWRQPPTIYLIRRNSEEAEELARIRLPEWLEERFLESIGHNKGVYAVDGEVRDWLMQELEAA